jgi:hypothetical protein
MGLCANGSEGGWSMAVCGGSESGGDMGLAVASEPWSPRWAVAPRHPHPVGSIFIGRLLVRM